MIKNKLFYEILAVIVLIIGGCVTRQPAIPPATSSESNFNLLFKYGFGACNELNTFKGICIKDMIGIGKLSLSNEELDRIYKKMIEIDFFSYPDVFSGNVIGVVKPHPSYYFKVEYNSKIKELSWEEKITKDEKAEKLMELIKLIIDILESKEEYKRLPSRGGMYR